MGLLTDLYNTVAKFFRAQDGSGDEASKSVATSRLKLVLMQDRTNLTPKILEQMRGELVDLLSKYLEMDKDLLELNFEQEGDQVALMLSIPVIRAKDEDEIEEALAAQKQAIVDESDNANLTEEDNDAEEQIESAESDEMATQHEGYEEDSEEYINNDISEENHETEKSDDKKYVDSVDMKKSSKNENSEEVVS